MVAPNNLGPRAQRTRSHIATSAQKLFRAKGWGISRQQIAGIAGVSQASVIHYFPTLRSLIHHVYSEEVACLVTAIKAVSAENAADAALTQDVALANFINVVANAIERRPMLAMSLLPFMTDPWSSRSSSVEMEVTFDMLVRTLRTLLDAHLSKSDPNHSPKLTEQLAKHTIHGMLGAAANRRTKRDIVEPALHQLL